jgi:hypothetical protein
VSDTRTQLMLDLQRLEQEQYQLREGEQLQDFVGRLLQYIGCVGVKSMQSAMKRMFS